MKAHTRAFTFKTLSRYYNKQAIAVTRDCDPSIFATKVCLKFYRLCLELLTLIIHESITPLFVSFVVTTGAGDKSGGGPVWSLHPDPVTSASDLASPASRAWRPEHQEIHGQ